MATTVQQLLTSEMAVRTDELATLKVEYAQVQAEVEEGVLKLRKADERSRRLRCARGRMRVAFHTTHLTRTPPPSPAPFTVYRRCAPRWLHTAVACSGYPLQELALSHPSHR